MRERLALLSALEVVALAGALIYFLKRISGMLDQVGGSGDSYLAKIGFGLRAIETETGHLAPQVGQLNRQLEALAGGLGAVAADLEAVARALAGKPGEPA